ncbi:MAG TPA: serine hydrolase, partial [Longimicrobiales bacterium]
PGHGDTGVDSHVSLPVITGDRTRIDTLELVPFKATMAAGADAVMVGHLAVPALTGDNTPATLSPLLSGELIRKQLGYKGIVITDAMTMGALRNFPGMGPGELAVRAVESGADIVLFPPDLDAARDALLEALRTGRLSQARIDASVRRVLAAKASLRLRAPEQVALDSVVQRVGSPAHNRVADELAARSIVLARDSAHVLPLDPRRVHSVAVIAVASRTDLNAGKELGDELARIFGRADLIRLYAGAPPSVIDAAVASAGRADAVVVGTFFGPVAGQGYVTGPGLAESLRRVQAVGKPMVVVSFGDPYGAATLPGASTYLLAWQPRGAPAQVAAARVLAGLASATGRLPVDLPGAPAPGLAAVPRGAGLQLAAVDRSLALTAAESIGFDARVLSRVDSLMEAAIADHATPGAALAIGRHGKLARLRGYGRLDYRPGFGAVTDSTLYDLASLTKVIATTTAAMWAVENAGLDIDRPVVHYLPEFRGAAGDSVRNAITVRQLLTHSSGLTSRMIWRGNRGRQQYLKAISALPLAYEPGTKSQYSDFNLILVGLIVERLTGKPEDVLLQQKIFGPLGMRDTRFNPLLPPGKQILPDTDCTAAFVADNPLLKRIAPTEIDTIYRHRHVQGIVHDENACALGGVAGHAGLFSSARDLAVLSQMLLDGGIYRGVRVLHPATIERFTKRQSDLSTRALGWDTPGARAFIPEVFSGRAFGHTGFTGTSIWVDPERDLFVVLLTNRVDPTRDNQKIGPLRRALADTILQALLADKAEKAVQQ